MKKLVLLLIVILCAGLVQAEESLYDFLDDINGDYMMVVGDEASAYDTLAATNFAVGMKNNKGITLTARLASEILVKDKLILIGNPCKNELVELTCKDWPYEEGETLVMVSGSNLILAGTTPADTRAASQLLVDYKSLSEFKGKSAVLIVDGAWIKVPDSLPGPKDIEVEEFEEESATEDTSEETQTEETGITEEADRELDEAEEPEITIEEKKSFIKRFFKWLSSLFS
ncbi:MAG: hypothetical protein KKA79_07180 [Nanoarchaeota archaeon]|nr:hypothetical protein [Nanoarchaeota archaeon]MCG2717212.1 hypothetical protein [Nanoarchaeota archaeon]